MLSISNVKYHTSNKEILNDISFKLNDGDILSIIGANGSGKSTLLKLISNNIKLKQGEILLFNKSIASYKNIDLAKLMSYLPQLNDNSINLTVENVVLSGRYPYFSKLGSVKQADIDVVEHMMELTGVKAMRNRKMSSLSGGEMQRAFLASALAQEAKLILLDEPTSFLDPKSVQEIFSILKVLNEEQGITIILISHDINNLLLLNSRFLGLKNGQILFNKNYNEINNEDINNLYDNEFCCINHPTSNNTIQVLPKV